jgi:NAD+ kinase
VNSPKKIILSPNPSRDREMRSTKEAMAILRELGFQTVVCSPFRDQKPELFAGIDIKPLTQEIRSSSMLITFGGDGTILHLAKLAALNKIPVLGINMGSLGFIAELEAAELSALRRLKDWDFETETRMMLDVTVMREGRQVYQNLGLNDAVIREGPISHVIHLSIASDGHHLADISGDGVIIATPTGSTAYSLSAGGPVVEPEAEAMVVCPICTHNMRFSSYVLSPGHTLTVELMRNGRKPVYLCVDESRAFALRQDDQVLVRKSKYAMKLVRLSEKSFCEVFAKKMLPGGLDYEK